MFKIALPCVAIRIDMHVQAGLQVDGVQQQMHESTKHLPLLVCASYMDNLQLTSRREVARLLHKTQSR